MQRYINTQTIAAMRALITQGESFVIQKQWDAAIESFKAVLILDPVQTQALQKLADIYRIKGELSIALEYANTLLSHGLNNAMFFNTRGTIYNDMEHHDRAILDYEKAIQINKKQIEPYINIINSLRASDQINKAISFFEKSQQNNIEHSFLYNNIGSLYFGLKNYKQSLIYFQKSVALDTSNLMGHENKIKSLFCLDSEVSLSGLEQAIDDVPTFSLSFLLQLNELQTNSVYKGQLDPVLQRSWLRSLKTVDETSFNEALLSNEFLNHLFVVAARARFEGDFQSSLSIMQRAAQSRPEELSIWNNLGVAYFAKQDYAEALKMFEKAQIIQDSFAMAARNIGVCHFMLEHSEEARIAFEKAYRLDSSSIATQLYLFGQSLLCCEWSDYQVLKKCLIDGSIGNNLADDLTASLAYLAAIENAAHMRIIAPKVSKGLIDKVDPSLCLEQIPLHDHSKIRVAYFSYDFRIHPVGYLTQEIYALHDRQIFEITALSYGPDDGSEFRKNVETAVDHFIDLKGKTNQEMIALIRALNLDIVVDLTGNTQHNKCEVMLARVAPIQCHWLGYVWSMGHPSYDYILGDVFSTPEYLDHGYVEKVARFPHTLQVASRQLKAADTPLTRASQGLPETAFVLCNFGSFSKLQPDLFAVWMRVLKALPNAVLWLARTNRTPKVAFDRLLAAAIEQGVKPDQIVFGEPMSRADHLRRYELADLALDTYPQGSGTTAIEALWMGCPMLSMAGAGETLAVRMAGGILNAVELNELVVNDLESYETLAITLGKNRQKVSGFRKHLLSKKFDLPLFNTPQQVKYLESALTTMFEIKRNNRRLESFTVSAKQ